MTIRNIKDAKDLTTNELVYFKGHAKATVMSDGVSVEDTIELINSKVDEHIVACDKIINSGDTLDNTINDFNDVINFLDGINDDEKLVNKLERLDKKQDALVSGENIATINGESLLNGTDIELQDVLVSGENIATINGESLLNGTDIELQDVLVSGENIKTINNKSLLNGTDIEVQDVLVSGENISTINNESLLTGKNIEVQYALVPGENIKTINGESILGNGNIVVNSEANVKTVDINNINLDDYNAKHKIYLSPIVETDSDNIALLPNTYYKKINISPEIRVSLSNKSYNYANIYCLEFNTDINGTRVYLPSNVSWLNNNDEVFESNCTYKIHIMNDLGICYKFGESKQETPDGPTDPTPDNEYINEYLTIQSLEDNNEVSFSTNNIMYQLEGTSTWSALNTGEKLILNTNQEVKFKMNNPTITKYGIGTFSTTGNYKVYGNIMSLLYGDDFMDKTDLTGYDYAFCRLFYNCTNMVDASELILPATTLANYCYNGMFASCTSLTTVPELPAMILSKDCYSNMFMDCTGLTAVPALHVTTLADNCYTFMFSGCTGLTTVPENLLPATTLAEECYYGMFSDCTSLVTAPKLPATTLAEQCYLAIFYNCTSLIEAPELPATTLAKNCYGTMFYNCTSLTTAPELPATILAEECYGGMFNGCTSLTTAPELPATTLAEYCYEGMFSGCSNLNYIKALFTTDPFTIDPMHPDRSYTYNWVNGVSSIGTFVKNKDAKWNLTGVNGIPSGWTVETV